MKKKTSKTKRNRRNFNLDEKIYCLCAIKPRCERDINEILQQSKKSSCSYLSVKFNELEHRKWLVRDKAYRPESSEKEQDKRKLNVKYYRADPFPVLERINTEKILLDELDEYIIRDKLSSPFFKYAFEKISSPNSIGIDIPEEVQPEGIERMIFTLAFLFFAMENTGWIAKSFKNIRTKKQYEAAKKSFKIELESIMKKEPNLINQTKSNTHIPIDFVVEGLIFSIIPESTLSALKFLNNVVKMWYDLESLTKVRDKIFAPGS
jgi:hypothetical protein